MKVFKVIIAGGREFSDYEKLKESCDKILKEKIEEGYEIKIVSGTANGADRLGERYAKEKGYGLLCFPADWDTFGKRAGYIRNMEMADNADGCICFWDGVSRGTGHMIKIARSKNLELTIINY